MLYGGIALQVLCIACTCFFSYALITQISNPYSRRVFSDGVIIALTVIGGVSHARMFYAMPYWVVIDDKLKTLKITYLLKRPLLVGRENMLSYNDTTIEVSRRSGTTTYSGFYLHLGDGRKVLFSERSIAVEDCVYIEEMLDYWGVKKGEDE